MSHAEGWSRTATEQDIEFCYRLLLNRQPDEEGFRSYKHIIERRPVAVRELVEMFLTSDEFRLLHPAESKSRIELVDLEEFRMYADAEDWAVGKFIVQLRTHEPHVTEVFQSCLRPGMAVADIGANIGYYTMLAASRVGPRGHVYAFEPNPQNCALLHLNAETNGFSQVELFPFALSDASRLLVLQASGSTGVTRPNPTVADFASSMVVRSAVFDDLLGSASRVDVIKIDIDGAEGLALRGAVKTLERDKPLLFTEFSPPILRSYSNMSGEEYLRFLAQFGYRFQVITERGLLVQCGADICKVIGEFESSGASHIDLFASVTA